MLVPSFKYKLTLKSRGGVRRFILFNPVIAFFFMSSGFITILSYFQFFFLGRRRLIVNVLPVSPKLLRNIFKPRLIAPYKRHAYE